MSPLVAGLVAALAALPARAEEPASMAWGPDEGISIVGSAGVFKPRSSQAKGDGFALGFEVERRLQSGLRYGFDLNLYGANYRTPEGLTCGLLCAVDPTMSLGVVGLGGTVGYGKQFGRTDLYAGAGLGLYFSTMTASESLLGIPVDHDEKDSNLGVDLRAGISFAITERTSLGIQVRRLALTGNFGQLGSMPIGGNFILLTLARCRPLCARP